MSADIKFPVEKSSLQQGKSDILERDRTMWLAVLQGLTIIMIALRKYLRVERCERCGR